MKMQTSLALGLVEVGLLLMGAVAARSVLARTLSPDEVPRVLVHRIAVIDRRHHQLVGAALALCVLGLLLVGVA